MSSSSSVCNNAHLGPAGITTFLGACRSSARRSDLCCHVQEQGGGNPAALLQQLQAAQGSPRQQALLLRMLQDSVLGAAAREPLAPRVLPALPSIPVPCGSGSRVSPWPLTP